MPKLLHIDASPRKTRSKSIEVAQVFLAEVQKKYHALEIVKLDLWAADLPPFDGDTLEAKYAIIQGQSRRARGCGGHRGKSQGCRSGRRRRVVGQPLLAPGKS